MAGVCRAFPADEQDRAIFTGNLLALVLPIYLTYAQANKEAARKQELAQVARYTADSLRQETRRNDNLYYYFQQGGGQDLRKG